MKKINFEEIMEMNSINNVNKPFIIYGAGGFAKAILKVCKGFNISPIAICDSNPEKVGEEFCGFKVLSFNEILDTYSDFLVLISAFHYYDDIKKYLLQFISPDKFGTINFFPQNCGRYFKDMVLDNKEKLNFIYNNLYDDKSRDVMDNILKARITNNIEYIEKAFSPNQYFNEITRLTDNECFVDAGAYTGDTIIEFLEHVNYKYNKIYAFEPSDSIFKQLSENISNVQNNNTINVYKNALFSSTKQLNFNDSLPVGDHKIDENNLSGGVVVEAVSLDEIIDEKVTFIKMDIEGSELDALKGAEKIIRKYKPKLAISVYHKVDDLVRIPEYIMSLGLDYKYYLRHHCVATIFGVETVFYAV